MVFCGVGISLCLSLYLLGITGVFLLPSKDAIVLFAGIFLVWLPTILLMNRLTRDFKQKDLWKAALRGCPPWMRNALWLLWVCVRCLLLSPNLKSKSRGSPPNIRALPDNFLRSFVLRDVLIHPGGEAGRTSPMR
jgi:hypothetical protein